MGFGCFTVTSTERKVRLALRRRFSSSGLSLAAGYRVLEGGAESQSSAFLAAAYEF